MKVDTNYAVLMTRKIIDSEIYLFTPQYLIEGDVMGQEESITFIDKMGTEYLTIHDTSTLNPDNEVSVGYIISEEELLNKYPELSIQEAKAKYFDDICDITHIGFCLDEEDKIVVWNVDLMEIASRIHNNEVICENNIVQLKNSDMSLSNHIEQYGGDHTIVIQDKIIEKLLNMNTLEEIKQELKRIDQENKEIVDHFLENEQEIVDNLFEIRFNNKDLNGSNILELFDESYFFISKSNDIEQIQSTLKLLEDFYLNLCIKIDEINSEKIDFEPEKEFLYVLIDTYQKLGKSNDSKYVQSQMHKIYENRGQIIEISKRYNELIKHENKRIELIDVFSKETSTDLKEEKLNFSVIDIKNYFDSIIIGQEKAKKAVILSIITNRLSDSKSKNSCLLVGPTGSGKTLIAETVSEYFKVPILIIDTTQLTVPGYQGSNIEDFLNQLLVKANGDKTKAEEGIVVFDEIDKKGSEKNEDVSGRGVLNTLLPFLQGTTYNLKYNGKNIIFDTSKLTIFATGAFTDIANNKIDDSLYSNSKIGFNCAMNEKDKEDIEYPRLEIEDFVKYGYMPIELMGRFSTIVQLDGHTKESLKSILIDSKRSTLVAKKNMLEKINVKLTWTEDYLDAVAEKALALKTGARSLKATVEESIMEVEWEIFENIGKYCQIILSKETVIDNMEVMIMDYNGLTYNLKNLRIQEEQKVYQKR